MFFSESEERQRRKSDNIFLIEWGKEIQQVVMEGNGVFPESDLGMKSAEYVKMLGEQDHMEKESSSELGLLTNTQL